MDSQKKKLLEETYERIINVGLCIVPYEDLSDLIAPELMLFGTTKDEKVFSFGELDAMFKSQYEQMVGFDPSLDRKRIFNRITEDGKIAIITEEVTLTISSPDAVKTIFIRCSCVMEYIDKQWKITHWHASTPVDTENDHWHQEEWKREKDKLQKLVDEQTADLQGKNRELEIEASIERVRAVAMGMTKPEEMLKVCGVISDQLEQFGVEHIRNVQTVIINEEKGTYHNYQYFTPYDKESFEITECDKNSTVQAMIDRMLESPDAFFTTSLTGEELATFRSYRKQENQFPDPLLDDTKSLNGYFFSIGPGGLGITLYRPLNEGGLEIFKRFHSVFSLAYRRFRDIEQAEAQAREAKIESALERVRSRSLAMHHSSELSAVVDTLMREFTNLEFTLTFCIINLINEQYMSNTVWAANPEEGKDPESYYMKFEDYPFHHSMWEAWKAQKKRFVYTLEGEEKKTYDEYLYSETEFRRFPKHVQEANKALERYVAGFTFFKYSGLQTVSVNPISDDELEILERFGRVFEQAYTRFLDLQKAEAQAREAEIQLALERVRAKTMAMKTQSDLLDIIELFGEQLEAVGIRFDNVTFIAGPISKKRDWDLWSYAPEAENTTDKILIPYIETPYFTKTAKAVKEYQKTGQPIQVKTFTKKEKNEFLDHYWKHAPAVSDEFVNYVNATPGSIIVDAFLKEVTVSLVRWDLEPCTKEELAIFERFAKEFRQTYIRFLDIKKAEAQAREAQVNLAVERVRARALAMFKSEEILEVVYKLKEEIMGLDIPNVTAATIHLKEPDGRYRAWDLTSIKNEEGQGFEISLDIIYRLEDTHPDFFIREVWEKTDDYFVVIQGGDRYNHTIQWLRDHGHAAQAQEFVEFLESSQLEKAYHPTVPLNNGRMCIDLLDPPAPEIESILKKMAGAFDLAYKRFEDLQNAEAQAREAEIQLALERVRARSMSMHKSEELLDVITVVSEQLQQLNFRFNHVSFANNEIDRDYKFWTSLKDMNPVRFNVPFANILIFKSLKAAQENGVHFYTDIITQQENKKWHEHLLEHGGSEVFSEKINEYIMDRGMARSIAINPNIILILANYASVPYTEEENKIIARFGRVFEQSYTRFKDLQKAEAQAREAKIETALEKVRSRTMGMQRSDELAEVANVLFSEMNGLVENLWTCGFVLCERGREEDEWWLSLEDGFSRGFYLPNVNDYAHATLYEGWLEGDSFRTVQLDGDKLQEHYDWLMQIPVAKNIFDEMEAAGMQRPEWQKLHAAYFSRGYLVIITREPCPEEEIFKRFATVFDQTYTRFLDLKKAEAQAREAQIEMALERVRSRTMAMQHSDELIETSELMFEQIKNLDIELWSCGFSLWYDDDSYFMGYNTGPDGKMGDPLKIPLTEDEFFTTIRDAKRRGDDFLVFESKGKSLEETYSYMDTLPVVGEFMRGIVAAGAELPKYQVTHCGFFSHGHLMFIALEHNPEAIDIFKRFTKVFEQTYTRFLDLQKAEAQAREAQIEVAVERVRAKALAMHKSTEILQVAITLKEQMEGLNLSGVTAATIYLEHDDNKIRVWDITELKESENGPQLSSDFTFRLEDTDPDLWVRRVWNAREKYSVIEMSGNDFIKCEKWIREFDVTTADNYREFIRAAKIEHTWHPTVQLEKGKLNLDFTVPPPLEMEFILPKMGAAFDLAYRRFLDLQKAERQTREAQIEASLERVRAKAMSMQNSDELDEVLSVLCEQFDVLGILPMSTHMTVFDFSDNTFTFRETGKYGDRSFGKQTVDLDAMDTWKETVDKWKADKATAVNKLHFPKETLAEVWEVFHESFASMPEESRITPDDYPDGIYHTAGKHPFGYIGMNQIRPATGEEEEIVIKFANEFGRAYQRFLDLQKAEEQAREAKIETALEKIRSRTMAMQKGEELQEVAVLLYKELIALGVTNFVTCGYVEVNEDIRKQHTWVTAPGGDTLGLFHLPLTGDDTFDARYAAWKKQQPVFHQSVAGQVRSDHLEYAITTFNSKEAEEMVRSQFPDPTVFYCFNFSNGYLHIVGGSLLEKEEENLLARFTKVFEQTYTRFLDLQKAEEQAREAKIEMSLEKIRSRTMGMQGSEELPEVANMLFLEVQELGIPAWSCGYCILTEDRRASTCIMSSEGTLQKPFLLPHFGEPSFEEWDDFVHGDQTFFTQELKGEAIDSHYNFMKSLPQLTPVFREIEEAGLTLPTYQINHLCKFSNGFMLFITYEEVPGSHDIFKRFTSVFDQTYTRFLDLKKSEKRAREAEVDLSLERVRSQVTAMQESSDLLDVVVRMRSEFVNLGHEAHYFWHMRWLPDTYKKAMTSGDGTRIGMVMTLPRHIHGDLKPVANWEKSAEPSFVLAMDIDAAVDYVGKMISLGDFEMVDPQAPSLDDIRHIGGLTFVMARTTHGEIGFSLPGFVPYPSKEAVDTLIRFAGVFDLAYKRFEDLKKAEKDLVEIKEARIKAETALAELKATQSQLIQSEKMASLGELTAGIAHEIQNPLNFVNNFSEVSNELIDEATAELVKTQHAAYPDKAGSEYKEVISEALTILGDVKQNLEKIHHHGKRADAIVKGMLAHSRSSSGEKIPTNINALADEYLRLSYHGLRAKDKTFNADFSTDLDPTLPKVNVVPQDIGRVMLNLINNAFQAVNGVENPKVTVKTREIKSPSGDLGVQITVSDNGSGIPDTIKDKIFQPFFTTKPTGEGTGLGLSLSYDIVKAHGGRIEITSLPGEGSTFIIQLPKSG